MGRRWITSLACLSLLALIPAVAGADSAVRAAGTTEFSPSLAFSRMVYTPAGSVQSSSVTNVNLSGLVGHCINNHFELVGLLLAQHRDQAGLGRNAFGGGAGVNLNLDPYQNLNPFFMAGVGALSYTGIGSPDRAILAPMLRLGVTSFIAEGRALNLAVGYQHEINRESSLVKGSDAFEVAVGVSFLKSPAH